MRRSGILSLVLGGFAACAHAPHPPSAPAAQEPPAYLAALTRDPSILRGPDGVFHLVWTIAWTDHAIGVAHSRDLIHWSEQTRLPVMEHEHTALNTWAPDLFYDAS